MNSQNKELKASVSKSKDGLGITLDAMFDGMEGLLTTKTVVGEPILMGDIRLVPLIEISAGMAGGDYAAEAKKKGAAAMTAKMSPVAMLMIQGSKVRLINIKNQDALTELIDLIPEAIDKITGKRFVGETVDAAKKIAQDLSARIVKEDKEEKDS